MRRGRDIAVKGSCPSSLILPNIRSIKPVSRKNVSFVIVVTFYGKIYTMYFNHVFHFLQLVPDSPSSPSSKHGEGEEKKRAMERPGKREGGEKWKPGGSRKRKEWRVDFSPRGIK